MSLILNPGRLDYLFPAYLCLGLNGRIEMAGPSLRRHCEADLLGGNFFDVFEIRKPKKAVSIEHLKKAARVSLVTRMQDPVLHLTGAVLCQGPRIYLLVGHVPTLEDAPRSLNLSFSDFSPTDGSLDLATAAQIRLGLLLDTQTMADDLRQQKQEAEQEAEYKSRFLATMSHEIRTPMNGVMGMIDLVLAAPLAQAQRDKLELARDSARSLLKVIDDTLDFSKIQSGRLEIEQVEFEPARLIAETAALFQTQVTTDGVGLFEEVCADLPPWVLGDPVRIRQILLNLVGNAVKFTSAGRITLRVNTASAPNGPVMRFEVEDTGIGISAAAQDKVFDSFTQADASTTRRFGGTGLGLSIAKGLVTLLGGEIGVTSVEGEGSLFWFTVPYVPAERECSQDTDEAPEQTISGVQTLHVLLADDHPTNQIVLKAFLEALNHRVTIVDDGAKVLSSLDEDRFDLILMDIQMPTMDGLTAVQAIRSRPGPERTIPVVAVTANALEGDRETYLHAGMSGYLSKPIDFGELSNVIEEVMEPGADGQAAQRVPNTMAPLSGPLHAVG